MSWLHISLFDACMFFAMWGVILLVSYYSYNIGKEKGYEEKLDESLKSMNGIAQSPEITSTTHDRANGLFYVERKGQIERYDVSDPLNPKLLDSCKVSGGVYDV